MSLIKQLSDRAGARLSPKEPQKRNPLLDAVKEFRSAKTDEEAAEALRGFMELVEVEKSAE